MKPESIVFRRFHPQDLPEIIRLQNANLISGLSPAEQTDGFLSVKFSANQFAQMDREIPLVVADCGSRLGGFMCGCRLESCTHAPLLAHMAALLPLTPYKGRPIDQYQAFVYGPVCVDRPLRGKGVLEGLFRLYKQQLFGQFDIGLLFISSDNPRSMQAHIRKLGMHQLRDFSFRDRNYSLLIFDIEG